MKKIIKEFIIITFGTLLLAIGIYFFKFPNNFSTGGVSGISVILAGIDPKMSSSVAMMIKKYSNLNISKALFCTNVAIVIATFFVFSIETFLFSLLGFLSKIFVVNGVIENLNTSKYFTIITDMEEEISHFITVELHKGATISKNYSGAFRILKRVLF